MTIYCFAYYDIVEFMFYSFLLVTDHMTVMCIVGGGWSSLRGGGDI